MLPLCTVKLTSSVATRPPNRLERWLISSMGAPPEQPAQPAGAEADLAQPEQAVRQEEDHQHQQQAVKHKVKAGRLAKNQSANLGNRMQGKGAQHRTENSAEPADDRPQQSFQIGREPGRERVCQYV